MKEIVIASNNQGKIKEFNELFLQYKLPFKVFSLKEKNIEIDIPETGKSFEENALIKARTIAKLYNCNVIADDSGLEVQALHNQPGIYSARYAGSNKNDIENCNLLLKNMEHNTNRNAQFVIVIASVIEKNEQVFYGNVQGTITNKLIGDNGFGYDPIFMPHNYTSTFAELSSDIKNKISHRAKAFALLTNYLRNYGTQ
jgi:XTP/dITP diphosphohydrolase